MNWMKELEEARQYAKAAEGMKENRKVDNETLYHIICLSVEKYLATLTGMLNYIPMHSGLTFVVRELGKKMEMPSGFLDETRFLNSFMTYCSLDFEKPKEISESDLLRMVTFLTQMADFTGKMAVKFIKDEN
jgi:hypothetical protein